MKTPAICTASLLDDYKGTLEDLRKIVNRLIREHGKEAEIEFDSGHNNTAR